MSNIIEQLATSITEQYKNGIDYSKDLYKFACILVYAKCNSLDRTKEGESGNELLTKTAREIRWEVSSSVVDMLPFSVSLESEYEKMFTIIPNKKGELIEVKTGKYNKENMQDIAKRERKTNTDLDIVHDCMLAIIEYLHMHDSLLDESEAVIPSSMFYRNGTEKERTKWKYRTINGIRSGSLSISRNITLRKKAKENEKVYVSLESIIDGEAVEHYVSVPAIMTSASFNYGGSVIAETAVENSELSIQIPELANLTKTESYIYRHCMLEGMTETECIDNLGISERHYARCIDSIRSKCASILHYDYEKYKAYEAKGITLCKDGNEFAFASLGQASESLGISKSHLSELISNKRKSVSGYTLKA